MSTRDKLRATLKMVFDFHQVDSRHTHSLNSAASDYVSLICINTDCISCMRPDKTRRTRDRSSTHSLKRWVSTKPSIPQILFFNYIYIYEVYIYLYIIYRYKYTALLDDHDRVTRATWGGVRQLQLHSSHTITAGEHPPSRRKLAK